MTSLISSDDQISPIRSSTIRYTDELQGLHLPHRRLDALEQPHVGTSIGIARCDELAIEQHLEHLPARVRKCAIKPVQAINQFIEIWTVS